MAFPVHLLLCVFVLILYAIPSNAGDEEPLQDTCVADVLSSSIHVNGFPCKDPAATVADDFFSSVISKPGNTSNLLGSSVTMANVLKFPGLNTLGISYARIDYAKGGLNPPHVHPRATELLYVQKGSLYVGFINTADKLFSKKITTGELFVFPKGLVHFQLNVGDDIAVAIAAFPSQLAGTSQVAKALFASKPGIPDQVLEKAFQVGGGDIEHLKNVVSRT